MRRARTSRETNRPLLERPADAVDEALQDAFRPVWIEPLVIDAVRGGRSCGGWAVVTVSLHDEHLFSRPYVPQVLARLTSSRLGAAILGLGPCRLHVLLGRSQRLALLRPSRPRVQQVQAGPRFTATATATRAITKTRYTTLRARVPRLRTVRAPAPPVSWIGRPTSGTNDTSRAEDEVVRRWAILSLFATRESDPARYTLSTLIRLVVPGALTLAPQVTTRRSPGMATPCATPASTAKPMVASVSSASCTSAGVTPWVSARCRQTSRLGVAANTWIPGWKRATWRAVAPVCVGVTMRQRRDRLPVHRRLRRWPATQLVMIRPAFTRPSRIPPTGVPLRPILFRGNHYTTHGRDRLHRVGTAGCLAGEHDRRVPSHTALAHPMLRRA